VQPLDPERLSHDLDPAWRGRDGVDDTWTPRQVVLQAQARLQHESQ
jgi:hypothetical protein